MSEPKKDVLKIHFSDNGACDPKIVTALRNIMEEARVSRPAAARRLMALGCLALKGEDARQAVDTMLCRNAREMWRIAALLQVGEPGSDSEVFVSKNARRVDKGSAGKIDSSDAGAPAAELAGRPNGGTHLAPSPAAACLFSEDKRAGLSGRAEERSRMTQPGSKLSRALRKFQEANKPSADELNE